jgi:hypothetical protein
MTPVFVDNGNSHGDHKKVISESPSAGVSRP